MGSEMCIRDSTMRAHASRLVHTSGGVAARARGPSKSGQGRSFGVGVMSITQMVGFDAEDREIEYVYMVGRGNSDKFGRSKDPPFYEPFPTRELKNKARQAYGPYCLNCGSADHTLARDCPEGYINKSGLIHHSIGEGSPAEVSQRWARWQRRLRSYFATNYPQKK